MVIYEKKLTTAQYRRVALDAVSALAETMHNHAAEVRGGSICACEVCGIARKAINAAHDAMGLPVDLADLSSGMNDTKRAVLEVKWKNLTKLQKEILRELMTGPKEGILYSDDLERTITKLRDLGFVSVTRSRESRRVWWRVRILPGGVDLFR